MTDPKSMTMAFFGPGFMGYGMAQSAIRAGLGCCCRGQCPELGSRIVTEDAKGGPTTEAFADVDATDVTAITYRDRAYPMHIQEKIMFGQGNQPKQLPGSILYFASNGTTHTPRTSVNADGGSIAR